MWVFLVFIRNGVYKKYNPHKRYKLHSTKSTSDDEKVRQCNAMMARWLQHLCLLCLQNVSLRLTLTNIEFFCTAFMIVVSLGPYLLTQNSFAELEYEPCEPWAGLECTSDTADSCSQMLKKYIFLFCFSLFAWKSFLHTIYSCIEKFNLSRPVSYFCAHNNFWNTTFWLILKPRHRD